MASGGRNESNSQYSLKSARRKFLHVLKVGIKRFWAQVGPNEKVIGIKRFWAQEAQIARRNPGEDNFS